MTQKITRYFGLIALLTMPLTAISQEDSVESNNIEEITVTGSQIKARKSLALYQYLFLISKT